jgi:hypothetical protein
MLLMTAADRPRVAGVARAGRAGGGLGIAGALLTQRRLAPRLFACLMRPRGLLAVIRAELRYVAATGFVS